MPTTKKAPDPAAVPETPARFGGLDGLRAIAVSTVVLFHFLPGALPAGYIGVDVFFVISGFLITSLLLREHTATGSIRLRSFWARRARRLLPALALVVLSCTAAALVIGGDILVGIGRQLLGAATFSYNWLGVAAQANYFDQTTPELFRNLWSLAVEEQFYLVWPFAVLGLLALLKRRGWMLTAVLLLAIASSAAMLLLAQNGAEATRLYYGTDTHAFGLALGAAVAIARLRIPAALAAGALAGVLALSWLLTEESEWVFRGGLVLVAALTALAIAGATTPGSWLGRVLDVTPLRWVGERSYGLYLWHWPVLIIVMAAAPALTELPVAGIALTVTVAAAALSYRFIEQPVRRRGFRAVAGSWARAWRGGPVRLAAAAVSGLAIVGLVAAAGVAVVVAPASGVVQERIEAGLESITAPPPAVAAPGPSEPAPLPGGDQITAIGDSVMLAAAGPVMEQFPGIYVDAAVSRRMTAAPAILQSLKEAGQLRPIVLLGLGTNGPVDESTLREISEIVGPQTSIVLVNAQAPRGWIPGVNEVLARYAQRYRNVELANWYDAIQPRLDVLATDLVHAGGPIGGGIYAASIRDAMQRLAELPPLLNSNDYGLTPRPA